jgi:hypothetical protein
MPIILLLRHPCAVVASRLALGWKDNLFETMEQEDLVEDFLLPMETRIRAASDGFERHLFLWCIDNYVPLRQFGLERYTWPSTRTCSPTRRRSCGAVRLSRRGLRRPRLPQPGAPLAPEPQ